MLILAGVTISALSGPNGILTNASKAKDEQADSTVKELISLAYSEYQMEIMKPTADANKEEIKIASTQTVQIQGELEKKLAPTSSMSFLEFLQNEKGYIDEKGVVDVEALTGGKLSKGNGTDGTTDVYKVELDETTNSYTLKYYKEENESEILWQAGGSSDSSTGEIDWDKIFEEAEPAEGQSESNTAIGLGPNGEPVNMDYWLSVKEGNGYSLKGDQIGSGVFKKGYIGPINDEGQIEGAIPQYIKKDEDETFLPVTRLWCTFTGCTDLKEIPKIPPTVTNMWSTFENCTSLTTAPEIPSNVTNLNSTFSGCTSLTTAPEIPSSIAYLSNTFSDCTSLTTAPEIPSSVISMWYTFSGCTSLTTAPEIPPSVTDMGYTFVECKNLKGEIKIKSINIEEYDDCFLDAATSGETLTLVGSDEETLTKLQNTKGTDSKIEIRVEPEE